LEVSGAVRPIYGSLGVKRLNKLRIERKITQHCRKRHLRAPTRFVTAKVAFRQEGGFSLTERTTA